MKVKFKCHMGYAGTDSEDIVELPDGMTEEEIQEEAVDWFWNSHNAECWFEIIEDKTHKGE